MKTLDLKSNQGIIVSFLGWTKCQNQILTYQKCKKTGIALERDPTQCYGQARQLQQCYSNKGAQIQPLCLPIFNDAKQCLFKGDSHVNGCKQQLNEYVYCNKNPAQYVQFLKWSTPHQKLPKTYDFTFYSAPFDTNL